MLLAVVFAVVVLWAFNMPAWVKYWSARYSGDGVLSDHGAWSFPRYRVVFPPVELKTGTRRIYRTAGLPPVKMLAGINVDVAQSPAGHDSVDTGVGAIASNAVLHLSIQTDGGKVLYERQSPVHEWNHAISAEGTYLWLDGYELVFDPWTHYAISLDVMSAGTTPAGETVMLRPFLEGGGSELP